MASFISKLFDLSQRKNTSKYPEVKSNILQSVNINHPLVEKDEKTVSEELMELYIPFGRILPYYPPKYDRYFDSYSRTKYVSIELDNQYFFNDGNPTISNPTMGGYNKPFILSVGVDNIERTKIKKVVLFIEINKIGDNYKFSINNDIEVERTAHCVVYDGQTTMGLSQLLSNDISSSDSFYELSVCRFRAQYVYNSINGINHFLREIKDHVKDEVISHFKTEVDNLRKYVSDRKNRLQFEQSLSIDIVKDCFVELFDDNSNEVFKTEGNDYYYCINIPVDFLKLPTSNNSISLNDEATELLFNISEGSNRIRGIYDCCVNMSFDFNHNGNINGFRIDIKPIEF
jgi:hypothetical protein